MPQALTGSFDSAPVSIVTEKDSWRFAQDDKSSQYLSFKDPFLA